MALLVCLSNASSCWQQCKNFGSRGGWHEFTFCVMANWLSIVIICWYLSLFPSVFDASFVVAFTASEFAAISTVVSWSGPSYVVSFF